MQSKRSVDKSVCDFWKHNGSDFFAFNKDRINQIKPQNKLLVGNQYCCADILSGTNGQRWKMKQIVIQQKYWCERPMHHQSNLTYPCYTSINVIRTWLLYPYCTFLKIFHNFCTNVFSKVYYFLVETYHFKKTRPLKQFSVVPNTQLSTIFKMFIESRKFSTTESSRAWFRHSLSYSKEQMTFLKEIM